MREFNLFISCDIDHCSGRGLQKFHSVLEKKIGLEGLWEVGVSEINFTNSMINIPERQNVDVLLSNFDNWSVPEKEYQIRGSKFFVEPGQYAIDELIDRINYIIPEMFTVYFAWNNTRQYNDGKYDQKIDEFPKIERIGDKFKIVQGHTRKFGIKSYNGLHYIRHLMFLYPSEFLCNIFGFNREQLFDDAVKILLEYRSQNLAHSIDEEKYEQLFTDNKFKESSDLYKLKTKSRKLFLTSDICEDRIYGEKKQPLLSIIEYSDTPFSSRKSITYNNPVYIKVKKSPFQLIEFRLLENLNYYKDSENIEKEINFKFGDISMVLNFRQFSDKITEYEADSLIPNSKLPRNEEEFDDSTEKFDPSQPPKPKAPIQP